jgi:MFS family permease
LNQHGRAFGFERAMDTIGAVLGPLCAWAFIGMLGIRGVFRWTIVPGLLAAIVFVFLAPAGKEHKDRESRGVLASFRQLPKGYWPYLAGVFAHGIGDFAPTLLILRATQILTPQVGAARAATFSIALYTFHNLVNAAASYVSGVLGDRMRKRALLAAGYVIGVIAYAGFILLQPTIPILALLFGLAGVHIGFAQSLEKSAASEILPAANRGSGFGVLATVNGIGDLVSSVVVGALWSAVGATAGFLYAAIFGFLGAVLIYRPARAS